MNLIIGGAYQGKTDYAKEMYSLADYDIANGKNIGLENINEAAKKPCIKNFHLLVRNVVSEGGSAIETAEKILHENPHIIIVTDEVGGGIIPLEKADRVWREEVGRTCCYLAKNAKTVTRIISGLPMVIKEKKS